MNGTMIGIVILVVALIVGPFATLKAISYYKSGKSGKSGTSGRDGPTAPAADVNAGDDDDPDKKRGFW